MTLNPGDWYLGNDCESVATVLGSCVAVTAWHPELKVGGFCHYILPAVPSSQRHLDPFHNDNAGRYGKTALILLKKAMLRYAPLKEYKIGLFGGSDSLSNYGIGKQNIFYAQQWLYDEKLTIDKKDVGGLISRTLVLHLDSGVIDIKESPMKAITPPKKLK
ncbi:MAG: chemotaxis protein CheB [Chitinophagaceae bacterium]|nr:MAG: chemotaxis protein CheB [Chitinophagaceae bacterium]